MRGPLWPGKKWLKPAAGGGLIFAALLLLAAWSAAWMVPFPARLLTPPSRVIEFADGTPMFVFLSPDERWRLPIELAAVDPDYIAALLSFEDQRFYSHPGVDPLALLRATVQNLRARRIVSGGSTITMQLARILEPRPRTLRSKFIEMMRALQLEMRFSKKEILAFYLQFAPYGRNLEGVEAASWAFFGHSARDLSPGEIVCLLAIPQRPSSRWPSPENTPRLQAAMKSVIARLSRRGVFDPRQTEEADSWTPPLQIRSFPREAPHAAHFLARGEKGTRVPSTLRRQVQTAAEKVLSRYKNEYAELGIHNASVVVVEVKTGRVAAAVGSFDFWENAHHGQVPGFLAPRSPGSLLKPFIYALALEQGLILPSSLVPDVPVLYDGYNPINYDKEYRGLVRLEDALSQSLNIPFVNLLAEIGLQEYLEFLTAAGVRTLMPDRGRYGLSVAVGGMEIRPVEAAALYAMMARGGEYRPLLWTRDEPVPPGHHLLSPGSAYLTRSALRRRDRPDFPRRRLATGIPSTIFWKTGTSSRHRDAWAAGANAEFAAVVWVGNFSGKGNHHLVGSERAGPILFDLLEALSPGGPHLPDTSPPDLMELPICEWSGWPAGPHCPATRLGVALSHHVPGKVCPYHSAYLVDKETGLRVHPWCAAGHETEWRQYLTLPQSLHRWLMPESSPLHPPPSFAPHCQAASSPHRLKIVSPAADALFFLIPGLSPEGQEIKLEAEAGPEVSELYWFVDGRFLGRTPGGKAVWFTPLPGEHEIRVEEPGGGSAGVRIKVLSPG